MLPCKMTHVFLNFVLIQQTFTLLKYRKTQHYLFVFTAFVCIFKFYVVISPPPCKLDDIYDISVIDILDCCCFVDSTLRSCAHGSILHVASYMFFIYHVVEEMRSTSIDIRRISMTRGDHIPLFFQNILVPGHEKNKKNTTY